MAEKSEQWGAMFDLFVACNIRGKWCVADMRRIVSFYDTLTAEEQARFEREVNTETDCRYEMIFGKDCKIRATGSDSSEGCEGTRDETSDEVLDGVPEVLTTFDDIEKVNRLMNEVLSSHGQNDEENIFPPPPPPPRACRCCCPSTDTEKRAVGSSRGRKRGGKTKNRQQITRL